MSYYKELIADIIGTSQSPLTYGQVDAMVTQAASIEATNKIDILLCLKRVLDVYAAPYLESLDKLQSLQAPTKAEMTQLQQDILNMAEEGQ